VHPDRENPGFAYEKSTPPYVGMGPRMVNSALLAKITDLNEKKTSF